MKKMLFILMALLIATPAMAAVTLTNGTPTGTTVTVGYSYDGTGKRPRAFALTLLSTGGTITSVAATFKGSGAGYGIFPGTFKVIDANGNNQNWNTTGYSPVEPNGLPGGGALTTHKVIVALGSLYAPSGVAGPNQPANSGNLFTITFSGGTAISVTPETAYRGGVVGEDANTITVATLNIPLAAPDCFPSTRPNEYAQWVLLLKPSSWCNVRQCYGDADGLSEAFGHGSVWVGQNDLTILTAGWKQPYTNPAACPWIAADFSRSSEAFGHGTVRVGQADLTILVASWKNNSGPVAAADCLTANPAK